MGFSFDQLGTDLQTAVSRRIDNELNSDFLPAPDASTNEAPVIKTADNETGVTKVAGTGGSVVAGIPNPVLYGGGALLIGLVVYMAVK